jgi:protein-tyrosine kinase
MKLLKHSPHCVRKDKQTPPESAHPASLIRYTETPEITLDPAVLDRNLVVTADGNDPVTLAYKMLRTRVLQHMTAGGWNVLAITSPGPGEGKTLTALNLAISLSKRVNHTVLLVELDLRRPTLHQYLGYQHELGITDYLLRDVPLKSVMFNPGIDRLVVIQAGGAASNSSELLSSPRMADLAKEIKERYPSRMVLFDLPPLLSVDDALVFLPYIDAALLVVSQDITTQEEVTQAKDFLGSTHVIGAVMNHSTRQIKGL